jgi:hypothetical protein
MAVPGSPLGAEFERRFYPFADVVIRLAQVGPAERAKALQEVYGRHLGYILSLLSQMASEGDFNDWQNEQPSRNLDQLIQTRAKQHISERQAKQTYR